MDFIKRTRLPEGVRLTDTDQGYSLWHLLAAGLVDQKCCNWFLTEIHEPSSDVLLDDLREGMAFFPHWLERDFGKLCHHAEHYSWLDFQALTAWKDPLNICVSLKSPLLSVYKYDFESLPNVVAAFVQLTEERVSQLRGLL